MSGFIKLHIADRMIAFSKITGNGMSMEKALHHAPKLCGDRYEGGKYLRPFYFYRNKIYGEIEHITSETVMVSIGTKVDRLTAGVNMNQMVIVIDNEEIITDRKDICSKCMKLAQESGIMIFDNMIQFRKICRY